MGRECGECGALTKKGTVKIASGRVHPPVTLALVGAYRTRRCNIFSPEGMPERALVRTFLGHVFCEGMLRRQIACEKFSLLAIMDIRCGIYFWEGGCVTPEGSLQHTAWHKCIRPSPFRKKQTFGLTIGKSCLISRGSMGLRTYWGSTQSVGRVVKVT